MQHHASRTRSSVSRPPSVDAVRALRGAEGSQGISVNLNVSETGAAIIEWEDERGSLTFSRRQATLPSERASSIVRDSEGRLLTVFLDPTPLHSMRLHCDVRYCPGMCTRPSNVRLPSIGRALIALLLVWGALSIALCAVLMRFPAENPTLDVVYGTLGIYCVVWQV